MSGGGTITPVTPSVSGFTSCGEYVTVTEMRDEYGDDIAELSDATIQRRIDRLASKLEDAIGHTFGRALIARSNVSDTVEVTATSLIIGGVTYLFADYATLGALVDAVNSDGGTYRLTLLPHVNSDTPSTSLAVRAAVACGPTYGYRQTLCMSSLYVQLSGDRSSYAFLPLPLRSVVSVSESGTALTPSYYFAIPGESWIIRKACACVDSTSCCHPFGRWLNSYPGNIIVNYIPAMWASVPDAISSAIIEAFGNTSGLAPLESENFGEYSYRRGTVRVDSAEDIFGSGTIRRYGVKLPL